MIFRDCIIYVSMNAQELSCIAHSICTINGTGATLSNIIHVYSKNVCIHIRRYIMYKYDIMSCVSEVAMNPTITVHDTNCFRFLRDRLRVHARSMREGRAC